MDIKVGTRSFLEADLSDKETKPRTDLFLKMMVLAPNEATAEERRTKTITKRRYMLWRERDTSSATLGFRVEGIRVVSFCQAIQLNSKIFPSLFDVFLFSGLDQSSNKQRLLQSSRKK